MRNRINWLTAAQSIGMTALLGLGCASTPDPDFYTLDMSRSENVMPELNIDVQRIRSSEAVGREGIMILTSPTQIEYYALDRWVANVGEMVAEKLSTEFGAPKLGRDTVQLNGDVLRFGQVDTDTGADADIRLSIVATSSEGRRGQPPILDKIYEKRIPASSKTPAAVVEALSRGVEMLAIDIAADIQAAHANQ